VLWLVAERRLVHARRRRGPESHEACCGGEITEKEGVAPLHPGDVTRCMPSWGSFSVHFVRLGQPTGAHGRSWTGTALCGRTYRAGHWSPLPRDAPPGEACKLCLSLAESA
jgi:hypothetical protein